MTQHVAARPIAARPIAIRLLYRAGVPCFHLGASNVPWMAGEVAGRCINRLHTKRQGATAPEPGSAIGFGVMHGPAGCCTKNCLAGLILSGICLNVANITFPWGGRPRADP